MFNIYIDLYFEKRRLSEAELKAIFNEPLNYIENGKKFEVKPNIYSTPKIIDSKKKAHLTFIELSKGHPLIMFNSGFLAARNAQIMFMNEREDSLAKDLPDMISYGSILNSDLDKYLKEEEFKTNLGRYLTGIIKSYFQFHNHLDQFWFNTDSGNKGDGKITVIGGRDFDPRGDRAQVQTTDNRNNDIYPYGDKDTFIDACMFLSRYYPTSYLDRTTSDKKIQETGNMVIIGGPGNGKEEGNVYTKKYMELINSKIRYTNDTSNGDSMLVEGAHKYSKSEEKTGKLIKDFGYFACFTNPDDANNRVVLINGTHTLGVLGAFLAFSDDKASALNYKTVLEKAIKNRSQHQKMANGAELNFECYFEVEIDKSGNPLVPKIAGENIFFISNNEREETLPRNPEIKSKDNAQEFFDRIYTIFINQLNRKESNRNGVELLIKHLDTQKGVLLEDIDRLNEIVKIAEENRTLPLKNLEKIKVIINAK